MISQTDLLPELPHGSRSTSIPKNVIMPGSPVSYCSRAQSIRTAPTAPKTARGLQPMVRHTRHLPTNCEAGSSDPAAWGKLQSGDGVRRRIPDTPPGGGSPIWFVNPAELGW
jgi:hypothetical protein